MRKASSMPASVWCLAFFVLCELIAAFWIAYYLSCPCCWPFRALFNSPECYPKTDPQCPTPPCVRKCCPYGEELFRNTTNKQTYCIQVPSSKFNLLEIPLWEGDWIKKIPFEDDFTRFTVVNYGLCTEGMYVLDPLYDLDQFALLPSGRLLMIIERKVVERDGYCVENYVGGNSTNAFRCFPSVSPEGATTADVEMKMFPLGMVISLPFFIVTVFVYSILPELQNLHGKTLICHVTSLSVGYIFLSLVQRNVLEMNWECPVLCTVCAFVIQFAFLATFFWLNVMCFDIWWVFSGLRPLQGSVKDREHKKFIFYSLYAWGGPLVIFTITICMELIPSIPDTFIKPHFGVDKCWFKDYNAVVLYFYLPIGVLVLLNIVMFVTTAIRLRSHTKETKVLKGSESRRNDDAERQRFNLYLKLFIVMGINWVMELVSFAIGGPKSIWFVTDISNTLQGLLIFLIFVWKRRVLRLLNQRLCPRWDLVAATSTSVRSKVSTRTSSTGISKTVSSNPDGCALKPIARAVSADEDSDIN